jgi:hypothetical protein
MLDKFRLDVDEAMEQAQARKGVAVDVWRRIARELEKGGPFADLLMKFRDDAVTAMSDLVYADANDPVRIAALQSDVQRCLRTMEHIDAFENEAQAADANTEVEAPDDE